MVCSFNCMVNCYYYANMITKTNKYAKDLIQISESYWIWKYNWLMILLRTMHIIYCTFCTDLRCWWIWCWKGRSLMVALLVGAVCILCDFVPFMLPMFILHGALNLLTFTKLDWFTYSPRVNKLYIPKLD